MEPVEDYEKSQKVLPDILIGSDYYHKIVYKSTNVNKKAIELPSGLAIIPSLVGKLMAEARRMMKIIEKQNEKIRQ